MKKTIIAALLASAIPVRADQVFSYQSIDLYSDLVSGNRERLSAAAGYTLAVIDANPKTFCHGNLAINKKDSITFLLQFMQAGNWNINEPAAAVIVRALSPLAVCNLGAKK